MSKEGQWQRMKPAYLLLLLKLHSYHKATTPHSLTLRDIVKQGSFEVFFPKEHVDYHPDKENTWEEVKPYPLFQKVPHFNPNSGFSLPVRSLCHVTHFDIAKKIKCNKKYTFKASPKTGRSDGSTYCLYDEPPIKPSPRTTYTQVSPHEDLLPGCYSWWSVVGPDIASKTFQQHTDEYKNTNGYGYLLSEQLPLCGTLCSKYGTVALSVEFPKMIQAYQNVFKAEDQNFQETVEVIFKIGGTLRYMKEICKVIIVCAKIDGVDPLPDFPPMSIDLSHPELLIKCGIKRGYHYLNHEPMYDNCFDCSWDTYAFAFHFPANGAQEMKLGPDNVRCIHVEHHNHDAHGEKREKINPKCLRGEWCPDFNYRHITLEDLRQEDL